jgi:hypothetical protein
VLRDKLEFFAFELLVLVGLAADLVLLLLVSLFQLRDTLVKFKFTDLLLKLTLICYPQLLFPVVLKFAELVFYFTLERCLPSLAGASFRFDLGG